jgi:hypothetical protein
LTTACAKRTRRAVIITCPGKNDAAAASVFWTDSLSISYGMSI